MPDQLKDRIRVLLSSRNICVLATVDKDRPYCSLMNYVTDDACLEFFMATQKDSNKYRNLMTNPKVSLLVDSREKAPSAKSWALTVEGVFEPLSDANKRDWALGRLAAQNPSINEFVSQPDIDVVRIRARSFLLLEGISDARYLKLTDENNLHPLRAQRCPDS
jgi:nitroimidazol reductase NimA-like FMN-containing flavoprotein (pyridoxamine 5'-phosphate oxidase superfamily)